MYDQLWEESPMIQETREQYHVQKLQKLLVDMVSIKYPDLAEFAQQQAGHLDKSDALDMLIKKFVTAPDEITVLKLLKAEK